MSPARATVDPGSRARLSLTYVATSGLPEASAPQAKVYPTETGDFTRRAALRLRVHVVAPVEPQAQDLLEKSSVGEAGLFGRLGQLLSVRDLGVGVRLERVRLLRRVQPEVDARVAAETKGAIDPLREVLDPAMDRIGQAPCLAPADPVLL